MKRARTEQSGDGRVRKAIAISSRIRKAYPYKDYGRAYFKRGSPSSLSQFGASFKAADAAQRQARRDLGFTGKGLYMGGKGGYWGRKIGGWFGVPELGDKLGDIGSGLVSTFVPGGSLAMSAARAAGKVFEGQGSYVSNSLVASGDPVPSFVAAPDGSTVTISHREYIGDVFAPPATDVFQNTAYSVNPGIERTFPWLSQIASNYDEYTIHQLMFSYRSTVADFASASGQVGQVIMATVYNASADPFSDKAQMMQYDATMSCKTSETMIHGVECDPAKLSGPVGRFVRTNPVLVGQDVNNYDHGLFNIAVTETPPTYANQAMGELWVSYTVQLRKPKYFTNRGLGISRDVFACIRSGAGFNGDTPFGVIDQHGNAVLSGQQNNIGGRLDPAPTFAPAPLVPVGLAGVVWNEQNTPPGQSNGTETLGFKYTFPANYAGNIRVAFRTTNTTPSVFSMQCYTTGNIFAIKDTIGDGNDQWVSGGTGNIGARVSTQWFDIRVETASSGVDNALLFTPNGTGTPHNTTNVYLDITEYNHGLSYKQDGSRDNLILVDASGTVQNI